MNKEFDFKSVGKQLPYKQEDEYFENITVKTILLAKKRDSKRILLRRVFGVVASVIIICSASLLYFSGDAEKNISIEEVITEMSDNELNTLMSLSENDDLLNENFE